jgi:hypothetical protein
MTARIPRLAVLLLLLVATGCISSPRTTPETGEFRHRRTSTEIQRWELVESHATDAYDAIQRLRPAWLRKRGQMSVTLASDIMVYMDNVQIGGTGALRSIPVTAVISMQFLDATSATQRWGTNHVHGAILIRTM